MSVDIFKKQILDVVWGYHLPPAGTPQNQFFEWWYTDFLLFVVFAAFSFLEYLLSQVAVMANSRVGHDSVKLKSFSSTHA